MVDPLLECPAMAVPDTQQGFQCGIWTPYTKIIVLHRWAQKKVRWVQLQNLKISSLYSPRIFSLFPIRMSTKIYII